MSEKLVYKKRFYDLETEECWLNEMCGKGLVLKKIDWGFLTDKYIFEPCTKKYVCRIDYNPEMEVLDEITSPYTMFVTGTYEAEFICCANGKLYFRKAADNGDFPPIYTSIDSRIAAEKKQLWRIVPAGLIALFDVFYVGSDVVGERDLGVLGDIMFCVVLICVIFFAAAAYRHFKKISKLKNVQKEKGGK